ncbi:glycosyltransferase [Chloroflexota bacterium]
MDKKRDRARWDMKSGSLQIVLPVYNEKDNIFGTLKEIETKVKTPHQILIVYDFDKDNTLPAVREFIDKQGTGNVALIKNRYGDGVLNAIRTGFDSARDEDVVLVTMADLSDDLSVVDAMFEQIGQGIDIVCGSRYIKGGHHIGGPRLKKFLSWLAGLSLHLITRIPTHDISNSFKMYRMKVLKDIELESRGGFEVGMEIVVKAFSKGYKITEVPVTWRDRIAGESRFQLAKWLPGYLRWYVLAIKGCLRKKAGRLNWKALDLCV